MTEPIRLPARWSHLRCWTMIVLVFAAQLGCIFWLSDRSAHPPRKPRSVPTLALPEETPTEWLTLNNPALLAMPHAESFSGSAWLKPPPPEFRYYDWNEPPRWLEPDSRTLGLELRQLAEAKPARAEEFQVRPEPQLALPLPPAPLVLLPTQSNLRVLGEGDCLRHSDAVSLPPWPHPDVLTNTVVQVAVDSAGRPLSAVLLSGSGSTEADLFALRVAQTNHFVTTPGEAKVSGVTNRLKTLRWMKLVFEWQTVAPVPTNANPAS